MPILKVLLKSYGTTWDEFETRAITCRRSGPGRWANQANSPAGGFKLLLGFLLALLLLPIAWAGQVTLTWDPNLEQDLAGYRVYYGSSSGVYTNFVEVGAVNLGTIPNLKDGAVYFFAVTAYNSEGLESDYSNEVALTISSVVPPTVTFTRPTAGQNFTAPAAVGMNVTVNANGHSITKVQFLNGSTVVGEDLTAPYSFTLRVVTAGNYSLRARVVFGVGNTVDSGSLPIVVNSTTPTVVLTSPVNGSSWLAPATLNLTAAVTANGNPITKVQFLSGSTVLGEDLVAPYSLSWTNPALGTYGLTARVFWGAGLMATSPAVSVSIALPLPEVVLTSPFSEQTFRLGEPVSLAANVKANGNAISKVQFLVGSLVVGEDASAPYQTAWARPEAGTHYLVARLYYGSGQHLDSAGIFFDVQGLPEPWQSADVGNVLELGSATESSGRFELQGAGLLGMNEDGLQFVYQTLSGDGQITARVEGYSLGLPGAVQGVMIRESLAPGSTYLAMGVGSDGIYRLLRREVTGAPFLNRASILSIPSSTWLRVRREGSTLVGLRSNDGLTWTQIGSRSIPMSANVCIGMFVTSGTADLLGAARFTDVLAIP